MNFITERLKLKDILGDVISAQSAVQEYEIPGETEYLRKGLTPSDLKFEEGERAVICTITTLAKDRDNEVVLPEGMIEKHYRKNPIVPFCHNYGELSPGKNLWIKPNRKDKPTALVGKTVYAEAEVVPLADQIYQYQKAGFPLAKSIGFMPIKMSRPGDKDWDKVYVDWKERTKGITSRGEDDRDPNEPNCIYTKWVLLEYSDVPVPSNPEALNIAISKGLIIKPEVTEDYIRIPVRDCKITATIDISKKEGIKGLYCGKIKKVATYLFAKDKGWTIAKAKAWVKEHDSEKATTYHCECIECGYKMESEKHCNEIKCPECGGEMRRIERPGPGREFTGAVESELSQQTETKTVIPYKDTGEASEDAAWDGPKEVVVAEVSDLKTMCTWYDPEKADVKGGYKLPHHQASDKHLAVWRGVAAAMAALLGARGGVQIPSGDRKGVYNHLAKHYKAFNKKPPDFKQYTEWPYEVTKRDDAGTAIAWEVPPLFYATAVAIFENEKVLIAAEEERLGLPIAELETRSPEKMAEYFYEKLLEQQMEITGLERKVVVLEDEVEDLKVLLSAAAKSEDDEIDIEDIEITDSTEVDLGNIDIEKVEKLVVEALAAPKDDEIDVSAIARPTPQEKIELAKGKLI